MRSLLALPLLLSACSSTPAPATSGVAPRGSTVATTADPKLQSALASVVAESDGTVAVTVVDLATGARASIHGDARLPLMSVFKLPLTVVALSMVEEGKLALDQRVPIAESELRPTYSPIADAWLKGDHAPIFETMLRRVIQDSDNTVGDKLVSMEGGGAAITAKLRALGAPDIAIAEQEIEIAARLDCAGVERPRDGWTSAGVDACAKPTPAARAAAIQHEIKASPNSATTDALASMLVALDRGTLLPSRSRAWLLDALAGTNTGLHRLKGLLPAGTRVEHKTGTGDTIDGINVATNDVGIVTLPNGERFAIAVLTAGSTRDGDQRDATIAKLAKAAWDRFTAR
jgi:beta-lactamase class A